MWKTLLNTNLLQCMSVARNPSQRTASSRTGDLTINSKLLLSACPLSPVPHFEHWSSARGWRDAAPWDAWQHRDRASVPAGTSQCQQSRALLLHTWHHHTVYCTFPLPHDWSQLNYCNQGSDLSSKYCSCLRKLDKTTDFSEVLLLPVFTHGSCLRLLGVISDPEQGWV